VPKLLGGLVGAAESLQGQAQVAPGLGVIGPEAQGDPAAAGRALELSLGAVGLGEVGVEGGHARPRGDGLADQFHGAGVIALLVAQHAEQVQRVGVSGVRGQERLVSPPGLRQGALPVQGERRVQERGCRRGRETRHGSSFKRPVWLPTIRQNS
jgi:hypothetical protein